MGRLTTTRRAPTERDGASTLRVHSPRVEPYRFPIEAYGKIVLLAWTAEDWERMPEADRPEGCLRSIAGCYWTALPAEVAERDYPERGVN